MIAQDSISLFGKVEEPTERIEESRLQRFAVATRCFLPRSTETVGAKKQYLATGFWWNFRSSVSAIMAMAMKFQITHTDSVYVLPI